MKTGLGILIANYKAGATTEEAAWIRLLREIMRSTKGLSCIVDGTKFNFNFVRKNRQRTLYLYYKTDAVSTVLTEPTFVLCQSHNVTFFYRMPSTLSALCKDVGKDLESTEHTNRDAVNDTLIKRKASSRNMVYHLNLSSYICIHVMICFHI